MCLFLVTALNEAVLAAVRPGHPRLLVIFTLYKYSLYKETALATGDHLSQHVPILVNECQSHSNCDYPSIQVTIALKGNQFS